MIGVEALALNRASLPTTARPIRVEDAETIAAEARISPSERLKAEEAARGFESIFLRYMLRSMRASVPKVGFFQNSFAYNMYQEMFDERLSDQMAGERGLGIAELLYRDILRTEQGRVAYEEVKAALQDE